MTYSVQVIRVGRQELRPPIVYYLEKYDGWESFVDTIVVVRGGGNTVVINSGLPRDLSVLEPYWPTWPMERKWEVSEEEKPTNALRRVGVDPNSVDYLIVTPLQYYATSNIDLFTRAKICLLKRGWADLHIPSHGYYESIRQLTIPYDILARLVTDDWPRLRLLEDEDEILPGIRTFFAGAHHRSSVAVCIDTPKGTVVFSDCFFKFRNIEENIPIGAVENIDEAYHSYQRIRREATLVVPMFDPEIFQRFPGGIVA
ncbi:MAG: hypothetical protein WCA27_03660 [Candidatus Sulfotelmatobacter sp.]